MLSFIRNIYINISLLNILCISLKNGPGVATNANGAPIGVKTATLTVGSTGPVLLQDVNFLDEMTHFDRKYMK